MNAIHPKNYAELLEACKAATYFSWFRASGSIDLLSDDKAQDRRTAVSVRINAGKAGSCEIRTLCDFDAAKNKWTRYCQPQGEIMFQDKRGLKALMDWIKSEALKQCEWVPNPETLRICKAIAEAEALLAKAGGQMPVPKSARATVGRDSWLR